jgi:MFS family permease
MSEDLNLDSDRKRDKLITNSADAPSSSLTTKTGVFTSLRIANFRLLFAGSVFGYAIQWIQQVILNWLAYDLTGSGTILGTINLISSVSSLLVLPAVGILIDYFHRRNIMIIDSSCMFLLTLMFGFTLISGHGNIAFLFVFAFLAALIETLDWTVRQVLVFDIVPRSHTPGALALNQTGWSLMRVLGPSVGGFLLIWFSAGGTFLLQSGIYVLIVITAICIKLPKREKTTDWSSPLQNIREGIVYLVSKPVTRTFTLIGIIMPILVIPIFSVLPPIYAVEVFGDESGKVLGFLMASVGVGGIIGGIFTAYLRRLEHWGRLQMASLFLLSLALIAFAFSSGLPLALVLLGLAGFFEIIFLTTNQTLIQLSIPDELRGRVTAAINLTWILSPLGSLLAGGGSDLLGGPKVITIILASVAAVIVILTFLISPTVRKYRLSQGITAY